MKSHILKNPSSLIELLFGVVKYDYYLLHCYRVANKAANSLAKMGRLQEERFVYFVTQPPPPPGAEPHSGLGGLWPLQKKNFFPIRLGRKNN